MSLAIDFVRFVCIDYWNIHPPVKPMKLEPKTPYVGCITPVHNTKEVLKPVETDCVTITPIHEEVKNKQVITRCFGDVLPEEVL